VAASAGFVGGAIQQALAPFADLVQGDVEIFDEHREFPAFCCGRSKIEAVEGIPIAGTMRRPAAKFSPPVVIFLTC